MEDCLPISMEDWSTNLLEPIVFVHLSLPLFGRLVYLSIGTNSVCMEDGVRRLVSWLANNYGNIPKKVAP